MADPDLYGIASLTGASNNTAAGINSLIGSAQATQAAYNQQMHQQMNQMLNQAAMYPKEAKSKYDHFSVTVSEIANGFTITLNGDVYFCADIAAVGERITTIMATRVLAK